MSSAKNGFQVTLQRAALTLFLALSLAPWQTINAAEIARKPDWALPVEKSQNLFLVAPNFYRSAQLVPADLPRLQNLGIKMVVSLRAFHSDNALLKNSGIKLIRIGVLTWDIDDKHVVRALRAIRTAEKEGPVLLHCQHGADRTGLVTAMYRMVYQNWDRERALDELINGGYGYHAMWKNIPRYIRAVDVEKIRKMIDDSSDQNSDHPSDNAESKT